MFLTKGLAGDKIEENQAVQVNDLKIFLTDGSGTIYEAKDATGATEAPTYFTEADLPQEGEVLQFHYVDPNCSKVIAVANLGGDITLAEVEALELNIDEQQDATALALYAESTLTESAGQHNDVNADGTTYLSPVYTANLTLKPRVARFEVDGFVVEFNEDPIFNEVKISQIAFQNYYSTVNFVTEEVGDVLVNHIENFQDQASVYTWLDTPVEGDQPWYRDYFDLTFTPSDNVKDTPDNLAYHIFACEETPVMVIKLLADGQPAFLYTKGFFQGEGDQKTEITAFEAGKIYRMSAAGSVENDGSILIPEDKIDPMDRCLEITVEVVDWVVELVYPEF